MTESRKLRDPSTKSDDGMRSGIEDTHCVTSFPYRTVSLQTPTEKRMPANSLPWYRVARRIYDSGPEGEGQDVWKAWKAYQQGRKGPEKEPANPRRRKDSLVARSKITVPKVSEKSVHSIIDTNKPLPPVPRLDPAPKTRRTKHPAYIGQSPKSRAFENLRDSNKKPRVGEAARTWWKPQPAPAQPSLKSKISYPGPLMTSNTRSSANVPVECGGVGGPVAADCLPTPLQNTTDAKKERHAPPLNLRVPVPIASRLKGEIDMKGKAPLRDHTPPTYWRDMVLGSAYEAGKSFKQSAMGKLDGVYAGKRRKSSGASFGCQGVASERLDRFQVSEGGVSDQIRGGIDDKNLMPEPLFADRDSKFYQAYFEALDDY
ncbi:hypothetical protein ACJQWK_10008 [Exserohilum turcicum]